MFSSSSWSFSVETGLVQQCDAETSFTAGIKSSNTTRFKLISRISRGLQRNVTLLGRRSDLWRLQFSWCHPKRAEHLQQKIIKHKKGEKTRDEGKPLDELHQLVWVPKWIESLDIFMINFLIQTQQFLFYFLIKHPLLSLWPMTTVSVTGLNLNCIVWLVNIRHPLKVWSPYLTGRILCKQT